MRKLFVAIAAVVAGLTVAGVALALRNSSGTYSLAAGNPVIGGTVISSTWMNGTLGDLQTEMTDSLSRSGKGGMLAPLKTVDGTVAAPAWAFTNEPATGLYRIGASNPAMSVNGSKKQEWNAAGSKVTGTLEATGAVNADANATITGVLGVKDSGGTNQIVSITAPSGLAAGYSLTLPTALPAAASALTISAAGALAAGRLVAVGQQVSSSCGDFSMSSSTPADVTNLAVTITTTGRPVLLALQPDGTTGTASVQSQGANGSVTVYLLRGITEIARWKFYVGGLGSNVNWYLPVGQTFLDVVGAGTYTYKVQMSTAGETDHFGYVKLVAYEL